MRALVPLLPSRPTLLTTPMMSKLTSLRRMVEPTGRTSGKHILEQFPSNDGRDARRVSRLSSSFNQRPGPTGALRIWL